MKKPRLALWPALAIASIAFGLYADYVVRHDESGLAPPPLPLVHILFPGLAFFIAGAGLVAWWTSRKRRR